MFHQTFTRLHTLVVDEIHDWSDRHLVSAHSCLEPLTLPISPQGPLIFGPNSLPCCKIWFWLESPGYAHCGGCGYCILPSACKWSIFGLPHPYKKLMRVSLSHYSQLLKRLLSMGKWSADLHRAISRMASNQTLTRRRAQIDSLTWMKIRWPLLFGCRDPPVFILYFPITYCGTPTVVLVSSDCASSFHSLPVPGRHIPVEYGAAHAEKYKF